MNMTPANHSAITLRGVTKRFAHHLAVDAIDLEVPRGSIFGVLGPNGAGKTTTLRMILNIIRPDSGSISVLGVPSDHDMLSRRIGYLPEERGLYRKMKVRRVLEFLGELRGLHRSDAAKRIDHWLDRLSLTGNGKDWGAAKLEELSRGMQQKVQFIGTVMHDPELVILDEPFSGLDPMNAQAIKDAVLELRASGRTVVFSTHLMENAERMCDAVCIIARGQKVLDGTISEVRDRNAARYILVTAEQVQLALGVLSPPICSRAELHGTDITAQLCPGIPPAAALSELVKSGVRVSRFEPLQPSLHQIFVETVGAVGVEEGMSGHG